MDPLVRHMGFEPTLPKEPVPKTGVSANFTNGAWWSVPESNRRYVDENHAS